MNAQMDQGLAPQIYVRSGSPEFYSKNKKMIH